MQVKVEMAFQKVVREPDEFESSDIEQTKQLLLEIAEGGCDPCLTIKFSDKEAKQYELDVARINDTSNGTLLGWMVMLAGNTRKLKLATHPWTQEFVPVEVFGAEANMVAGGILSLEEAERVLLSAFAVNSKFTDLDFVDFLENFVPT